MAPKSKLALDPGCIYQLAVDTRVHQVVALGELNIVSLLVFKQASRGTFRDKVSKTIDNELGPNLGAWATTGLNPTP